MHTRTRALAHSSHIPRYLRKTCADLFCCELMRRLNFGERKSPTAQRHILCGVLRPQEFTFDLQDGYVGWDEIIVTQQITTITVNCILLTNNACTMYNTNLSMLPVWVLVFD